MPESGLSYRDSGVDIDAAHRAMGGISAMLRATRTADTLSDLGSFGGLYRLPRNVANPVLVASTDGVGTKLKLAFLTGRHGTVGEDLVNHCVNDILVQGARPLFFLDYVGMGRLEPSVVEDLVSGMARGCKANGCALLGGETAEMPDFYAPGEYDLAGFIVGVVDRDKTIDGKTIREGDVLLALPSVGLHTNGYSLARKLFLEVAGLDVDTRLDEVGMTVGQALLQPHLSYLPALGPLLDTGMIKGLAHITGGGLTDNIPRILPEGTAVQIEKSSWPVLPIFKSMQEIGNVSEPEMFRTFNMGVGMVIVIAPENLDSVRTQLKRLSEVFEIGRVVSGDREVTFT